MAKIISPYKFAKFAYASINGVHNIIMARDTGNVLYVQDHLIKTAYFHASVIAYGTLKQERRRALRQGNIPKWIIMRSVIKAFGKMWHRTSYNTERKRLTVLPHGQTNTHPVGILGIRM